MTPKERVNLIKTYATTSKQVKQDDKLKLKLKTHIVLSELEANGVCNHAVTKI